MKYRMKPEMIKYIHEYNYPVGHADIMTKGEFYVEVDGCTSKILIDGETYWLANDDIEPVTHLPEDLFTL